MLGDVIDPKSQPVGESGFEGFLDDVRLDVGLLEFHLAALDDHLVFVKKLGAFGHTPADGARGEQEGCQAGEDNIEMALLQDALD